MGGRPAEGQLGGTTTTLSVAEEMDRVGSPTDLSRRQTLQDLDQSIQRPSRIGVGDRGTGEWVEGWPPLVGLLLEEWDSFEGPQAK